MVELASIRRRGERKTAGRRQPGRAQSCEIGRLRPDGFGIGGGGISEREQEVGHSLLVSRTRCSAKLLRSGAPLIRDPALLETGIPGLQRTTIARRRRA